MVIMEKFKINMIGGGFQHDICSSHGSIPKYVEWNKTDHSASVSIHGDFALSWPVNPNKKNYGWVVESSAIISGLLQWITQNISQLENKFELIFTHDRRLLSLSPKMRLVTTNAVPWVKDIGIHEKTKLISMIASTKVMCPGHQHRQDIAKKFEHQVDLYGSGRPSFIEKKEDGLKDYYFSIAMENDNYPDIFCEKITDCFAMGTIPIFWGAPTIGEFFNPNGIITLTNDFRVEDISPDLYYSKMEYIKENYERAINMLSAEDYIYLKYIK
jgi:hypothetical protein